MTDHQARELLVKEAFNEGFIEGMREHTSSKGGNTWQDSKAKKKLEALSTRPTINPTTYEQEHNNTSEHNDT